jgi:hypothetical protein
MNKSVPADPVVLAYAPGPAILKDSPHLHRSWLIPCCPFCDAVHVHGAAEGPRNPHCPTAPDWLVEGWTQPDGYALKLGGEINDPNIFKEASKRRKRKYAAYLEAIEDRRRDMLKACRVAFQKGETTFTV